MLQRNIICHSVHYSFRSTYRQTDKFKMNTICTIFYTEKTNNSKSAYKEINLSSNILIY